MTKQSDRELVAAAFAYAKPSTKGWHRVDCPLCEARVGTPDTKRALGILATEWAYHCFRCHASGRLKTPPTGYEDFEVEEEPEDTEAPNLELPEGYYPLWKEPGSTATIFAPARDELVRRRVDKPVWEAANIGASVRGYAAYRIVVPVVFDGQPYGWVGRSWAKDPELKYLYPKHMPRGEILFNMEAVYKKTSVPLIVVEGIFDALPHWPNAVACLGKPTNSHVQILRKTERPIVIVLDGDAWEESHALAHHLKLFGKRTNFLRLGPDTDPGNYDESTFFAMVLKAAGLKIDNKLSGKKS